jgi:hypothetical protein
MRIWLDAELDALRHHAQRGLGGAPQPQQLPRRGRRTKGEDIQIDL